MQETMVSRLLVGAVLLAATAGLIASHVRSDSSVRARAASELRDRRAADLFASADTRFVTTADPDLKVAMELAFESMVETLSGRPAEDRVIPADEAEPEDLAGRPVVLIGSPDANRYVRAALDRAPVFLGEHTARFFDDATRLGVRNSRFEGALPFATLALRVANPIDPSHGAVLFTAAHDEALLHYRFDLDLEDLDYLIRVRDIHMRWGRYGSGRTVAFTPDLATETNLFTDGARSEYELSTILSSITRPSRFGQTPDEIYGISIPRDFPEIDQAMDALTRRAEFLRDGIGRLSSGMSEPRLRLFVYPDRQTKAESTGDFSYAHASPTAKQVHTLLDSRYVTPDVSPEMHIARADLFPGMRIAALRDSLPGAIAGFWRGRRVDGHARRLLESDLLPSAGELFDDSRFERMSPYVSIPAAASLIRFVLDRWNDPARPEELVGLQKVVQIAHFPREDRPATEAIALVLGRPVETFEREWREWLATREPLRERGESSEPVWSSSGGRPSTRIGGARLVHSFRLETGLGSTAMRDRLRALRSETRSGWVSVHPTATIRRVDGIYRIDEFPAVPGRTANGTPDGAIEECLDTAAAAGFHVMLAPRLRWADGAPAAADDAEWTAIFETFRDWTLHWALLGRQHGVDLYAVSGGLGAEMTGRLREWHDLTEDLRAAFAGPLLAIAAPSDDSRVARHWAFFDAIGLEPGPIESGATEVDEASLARRADEVAALGDALFRRYRKPILLTGLPSRHPGDGASRDLVERTDATDALRIRTLATVIEKRPWFGGAFAIDWPTDADRGRRAVLGRLPVGPTVRTVIADWYRGME